MITTSTTTQNQITSTDRATLGRAGPSMGEEPSCRWGSVARRSASDDLVVMAIVNRTPDSFFDQGATFADGAALDAVDRAVDEGADIVDIGGVKAGHGDEVDVAEELRRTADFVAAVRRGYPDLVISVDTWRARSPRAAASAAPT